jgi:hypothetical protein
MLSKEQAQTLTNLLGNSRLSCLQPILDLLQTAKEGLALTLVVANSFSPELSPRLPHTAEGQPPALQCPRGARPLQQKWRARQDPKIKGSDSVGSLVVQLGAAHPESEVFNPLQWADSLKLFPSNGDNSLGGLVTLVVRCGGLAAKDVGVSFLLMICHIQLVTTCQRLVISKGAGVTLTVVGSLCRQREVSLSGLYNSEVSHIQGISKPSLRTFQTWLAAGNKYAAVAGGGSIYVLVLIAGLGLKASLDAMDGDVPFDLANALRHPNKGTSSVYRRELHAQKGPQTPPSATLSFNA